MNPAKLNPFTVEWRLHPDLHKSYQNNSDQNWTTFERLPTLEDAKAMLRHQQKPEGSFYTALFEWRLKP